MNTTNLKELRELRNQEKAIKARIDEISTEATNEAVTILAEKGQVCRLPQVPTGTGGEMARECQGESQRAELSQGAYRCDGRICKDVRGAISRQGAGRGKVDGQGR